MVHGDLHITVGDSRITLVVYSIKVTPDKEAPDVAENARDPVPDRNGTPFSCLRLSICAKPIRFDSFRGLNIRMSRIFPWNMAARGVCVPYEPSKDLNIQIKWSVSSNVYGIGNTNLNSFEYSNGEVDFDQCSRHRNGSLLGQMRYSNEQLTNDALDSRMPIPGRTLVRLNTITMPPDSQLTIEGLVHAIAPAAKIVSGKQNISRALRWVTLLSQPDHAVMPGDFAIVPQPASAEMFQYLASRGAVGAALLGPAPRGATDTAAAHDLVLVELPKAADPVALYQAAVDALGRDTAEIYARLTQMFVEGFGLDAVAAELSDLTQKIVLIQDKRLRAIATTVPARLAPSWDELRNALANPTALPESLRDRKRAAQSPHAVHQELSGQFARLAAPIVAQSMARGFISFIAPAAAFDAFDARLIERGAAACALEMAKAKAVREVEKRVHGDFVDAIITGSLTREEASRWAERIGFPETGSYAAISLAWASETHPTWRRLETVVSGEVRAKASRAHARAREDEIVIFVALDAARGIDAAHKLGDKIVRLTTGEFPQARLAMGLGRPVNELLLLRESHRQAAQARSMAARLVESRPLYFGDLSVYRLLFQLEHSPELDSFCHEILGTLLEYDRAQKSNLVGTLSAYFGQRGNLAKTARTLHLHRNSLNYRIRRIREITHWDLENPETRLSIQLALRAQRLITPRG